MADLIVAEIAGQRGIKLTFREYTKSGIITGISFAFGLLWIQLSIWN